jgi:hypothetical protein
LTSGKRACRHAPRLTPSTDLLLHRDMSAMP